MLHTALNMFLSSLTLCFVGLPGFCFLWSTVSASPRKCLYILLRENCGYLLVISALLIPQCWWRTFKYLDILLDIFLLLVDAGDIYIYIYILVFVSKKGYITIYYVTYI